MTSTSWARWPDSLQGQRYHSLQNHLLQQIQTPCSKSTDNIIIIMKKNSDKWRNDNIIIIIVSENGEHK